MSCLANKFSLIFKASAAIILIDFLLTCIWLPIGVSKTYGFQDKSFLLTTYNGTGAVRTACGSPPLPSNSYYLFVCRETLGIGFFPSFLLLVFLPDLMLLDILLRVCFQLHSHFISTQLMQHFPPLQRPRMLVWLLLEECFGRVLFLPLSLSYVVIFNYGILHNQVLILITPFSLYSSSSLCALLISIPCLESLRLNLLS